MKLRTLSMLLLTAVLAVGAVGCKKKMDRVTPLPGYGGGSRIGDAPGDGLRPGGQVGTENANANPVPTFNPNESIPVSPRDITGRPQDREKYRSQTVYFDFDRSTVKPGEASKVQEVANGFRNEDPN